MKIEEIILLLISAGCIYFLVSDKTKLSEHLKNIIVTLFTIDMYFFVVFKVINPSENMLENPRILNYLLGAVFIGIAILLIVMVWDFGSELVEEKQLSYLVWMLTFIVLMFSFLYFIIYENDKKAFMYVESEKWYELAFDFLYYSFCRGLTFSGGTIEPMSFWAKFCSMIQIILFYFVIGKGLISYSKKKD